MSWRGGQPYGQDFRDRVLACGGEPIRRVAARFSVSPSYVAKVRSRLRETGSAEPGAQCNHIPAGEFLPHRFDHFPLAGDCL